MFKKADIDEKLLLLRDQEAFSEAESEAGTTRSWALEMDEFIDSLDDETVLVGVDCHI